jgi:hypothetical protein
MATVGVSITKSVSFRGATQEFSNVYYFNVSAGAANQADASDLIDKVKAQEDDFHSTVVNYVRGRCWTAGGTPGTNNMLDQHNLSGTGLGTSDASQDRERAILIRLRAGVDSRGNPVYLRKWFHSCGSPQGQPVFGSTIQAQTAQLGSTAINAIELAAQNLKSIAFTGGVAILCAKSGRAFDVGANFVAHKWLEHHQLGDQWRAQ